MVITDRKKFHDYTGKRVRVEVGFETPAGRKFERTLEGVIHEYGYNKYCINDEKFGGEYNFRQGWIKKFEVLE